jgi:hypothetical protein
MPRATAFSRLSIAAICLLGLIGQIGLAGCGRSVGQALPDDPLFTARDLNGDGALTPAEANLPDLAFKAMDRNGDGRLSYLEWAGAQADSDNVLRQQQLGEARRDQQKTRNSGATD